jgi:acyl-CoA synthetase (NDP forming)
MSDVLKALTAPANIALIGASDNPKKLTARPLAFLQQHGFTGRIYPVNPVRDSVMGLKAYSSVEAIPESIDHACILTASPHVAAALQDCARAGVKVVSVLADGYAEAGPAGVQRQRELVEIASAANILLIGPNSMGVVDTRCGFCATTNAAFKTETLRTGRLAVISQSGSLIGTVLSRGQARGVDFSTFISVGNEACTSVGELGLMLLQDDDIDGFVLFMETIRNARALGEFARKAWSVGKPVVCYMLGQSDEGQQLAISHTGALTGSRVAVNAFLKSTGIARVNQLDALFEAPAALMAKKRLQKRPSVVTVVSTTGGGGAMAIDQLSVRGIEIAASPKAVQDILKAHGIHCGDGKLVDVTLAGARYDVMKAVITELINDPVTGAVLVVIGSSAQFNPELAVTPIIDALRSSGANAAPVFGFPLPHAEQSIRLLEAGGVPAFRTVESCADSLSLLFGTSAPAPALVSEPPAAVRELIARADPGQSNEYDSAAVFAALGIAAPSQKFLPADSQIAEVSGLEFPLVAKIVSRDIAHKRDVGAVRTGIEDATSLKGAIATMCASVTNQMPQARIDGILLQRQCTGLGEALVGLTRDPLVGPMITVAAGGELAEVYRDAALRPAPVSVEEAALMIAQVKAFALLRGYRGAPKGDLPALAQVVAAVSQLALVREIEEAEINPLLVREQGEGVVMLDALIRKREIGDV